MWNRKKRPLETGKFGNQRLLCRLGHSHASKLESSLCQMLQLRERAGEIKLLQVQDHILLSGWYTYVPDFKCQDLSTGEVFHAESKGYPDARWPSTKKGWKHAGPNKLEIWTGSHLNPILTETIVPKRRDEMSEEKQSEIEDLRRIIKEKDEEILKLKQFLSLEDNPEQVPDPCTVGGI